MRGRGGPGEDGRSASVSGGRRGRAGDGAGDVGAGRLPPLRAGDVWELGPELVRACGIGPGARVLDVAAGSGNVALRAAESGASVVASDLSAAGFGAGRRGGRAGGGGRVGPGRRAGPPVRRGRLRRRHVLLRRDVRPGPSRGGPQGGPRLPPGRHIEMLAFRPTGLAAEFFGLLAPRLPPPPPDTTGPPLLWGDEDHVRDLLADLTEELRLERGAYEEVIPGGPEA